MQEFELCKYVGSRAILRMCNRKSDLPVPDFDGLNPSIYKNLEPYEILHVCPQALRNFVNKVVPEIKTPFILVTNNSDWTIPDDVQEDYNELIDHPLLVHWFSQNCIIEHPKITKVPIGLDYHSLTPSRQKQFLWSRPEIHSWGPKINPLMQEQELFDIQRNSKPFYDRQLKAYANFHFLMITRYGKIDRVDAFNTVSKDLVFYEPRKCFRKESWEKMSRHAFVLSPQGNGIDCHRTWEALCLGCIPIVKTSGLDSLFDELPVWIVSEWSDVTEENMRQKINEFRFRGFNYGKLTTDYWKALYRSKQAGSN